MVCLETNNMVLAPSTCLEGRRYLPPPCARQKKMFLVDIPQVAFLGPYRRVWREDLAPVMVSITAAAVADVAEKVGIVFFVFGDGVFGDK